MTLLNNLISSGHLFQKEENFKRFQFYLLNIILLSSLLFFTIASLASLLDILVFSSIFHKVFFLYVITNGYLIYLLRKDKQDYILVASTTMLISVLLFYFPLLYAYDEFRLIWFFLLLFMQFILLGKRAGVVLMVLFLSSILLLNYFYPLGFSHFALFSFFNALILFSIFLYFFIDKMEKDLQEHLALTALLATQIQTIQKEKKAKELLLQEVHHRVKNNLHIILSMIQLQQYENEENKTNQLLIDLENRINAIAKTYEILIVNEDLQHIDMHSYITQLLEDIQMSFSHASLHILHRTDIQAILPLKEAVYVGLIINELVTNAYKYAFSSDTGEVCIILTQDASTYTLTVKDNGVGFDVNTQKKSVGSKLVETLVEEQLQGTLSLKSENYTKYHIVFSL